MPDVTCAPIGDVWDGYPMTAALAVGIPAGASLATIGVIITGYIAGWWSSIAAASASPATLIVMCAILIAALIALIAFLKAAIDYLFKYKLACLDGDRCAVVHIESIVHNEDSDQSMNTILAPLSDPNTSEAEYKAMWQAGSLVYSDSTPPVSSRGWKFDPGSNNEEPKFGVHKLPLFHCEIQGKTNYEWLDGLIKYMEFMIALLAVMIVLAAIGAALGPFYYLILGLILLLILLAAIFGIKVGTSDSSGAGDATSNTDVGNAGPGPGGYVITDTGGRSIRTGDYAILYGLHVIDTGHHEDHDGTWCELHPVRAIAKIDQALYDAVDKNSSAGVYDRLCKAMDDYVQRPIGDAGIAASPLEHPSIDGCAVTTGTVFGTIRWQDDQIRFTPGMALFDISAVGPSGPPPPGGVVGTPGPTLAKGAPTQSPRLEGGTWIVSYAVRGAPLGTALTIVVDLGTGAWTVIAPGTTSFIDVQQVAGENPVKLAVDAATVSGVDFTLTPRPKIH